MRAFIKFFPLICFIVTLGSILPKLSSEVKKPYGVFIGADRATVAQFTYYNEVVIDAQHFQKEDIDLLHNNKIQVYSYLNVGSLENFRPYYNDFSDITLSDYEGWPNERWIDVSKEKWQNYLVNTVAKELSDKGVDGFFLDNCDVYSKYPKDNIFNGILKIIQNLKKTYNKKIIINSGFNFINKAAAKKIEISKWIKGVNSESVLTKLNLENDTTSERPAKDTNWALKELKKAKTYGLDIYVLEYSNNPKLDYKIKAKYAALDYKVYISKSKKLE